MSFLYPAFAAALLTLAIPVIVHLFYFRRFKRIYFTNVRLLKEVKDETSNRRKLRNLLVLLMRCLAVAAMVLAFMQPFIPKSDAVKRGEQAVSVYIDNSFSMEALAKDVSLLERAKQRGRDIISAYAADDRFQVLTNDFEGRDQRLVGKEDALSRIEEIRISPASRDLSKVALRQQQCLNTGKSFGKTAYLLSDFQQNIADLKNIRDTLTEINLVPMRAVQERNVSIDSVWFESPVQVLNQPANLFVKISNHSDEDVEEARLSLLHDGQSKPAGAVQVRARSSRTDTVRFNILHPGWHEARLSITDYPVQFDDDFFLSFQVAEQINVLCIDGVQRNKYVDNAFAGAKYFRTDHADARALDYSKFANYQLILLNELSVISSGLAQELKTFAANGGSVLVFPAQNADLNSYNTLLQNFEAGILGSFEPTARQGSQINTESFIFRDVFLNKSANLRLPSTQGNFKLAQNRGDYLLTYRDGSGFLAEYPQGEGALYLCAAPLDEKISDLVRNGEIFVPMLFKMAIAGTKHSKIAYTIGKDEVLETRHTVAASGEMVYRLKLVHTSPATDDKKVAAEEFIPEQRVLGAKVILTPGPQVRDAGWYRLGLRGDSTVAEFAFNYDRKESDLRYRTDEELLQGIGKNVRIVSENMEKNFAQIVEERNQGIVLWRWCVVFALLFLLLEALFLRLWKV